MKKSPKIAIVYDWLDKWGGVERILLTLHQMFPKAPFYTSYFDEKGASWAKKIKIRPSFIQNFPPLIRKSRLLSLPFYLYAFESFDLSGFDLVISVTSSFAKSVITKPETIHICYLLTPTRYLWIDQKSYFQNNFFSFFSQPILTRFRTWDYLISQRPDSYLSISKTVQKRAKKYYGKDSTVLYPPFDIEYWKNIKNQKLKIINTYQKSENVKLNKFFLVVSRLEPYKKVDLVLSVFNKTGENLIVVGKGSQLNRLKRKARQNAFFLDRLTDEELAFLYLKAQALIMPQEEEFGYVALEAQFFGLPVIAYKKGGATETVVDGETGIFFEKQEKSALTKALEKFHTLSYTLKNKAAVYGPKNVEKFAKDKFIKKFQTYLKAKIGEIY